MYVCIEWEEEGSQGGKRKARETGRWAERLGGGRMERNRKESSRSSYSNRSYFAFDKVLILDGWLVGSAKLYRGTEYAFCRTR